MRTDNWHYIAVYHIQRREFPIKAMSAKALCGVVGITSDCNIYCHPQVTSSTLVEGTSFAPHSNCRFCFFNHSRQAHKRFGGSTLEDCLPDSGI